MAHVIKTLQDNLGRIGDPDPFYATFATPPVLAKLIEQGALGQKSGAGFYKKVGKDILRLDPPKGDYVPGGGKADEIVARILKKPPAERLKLLRESKNPQAQFIWAILRDSFHYAAVHLAEVAESARDIDFAMRWGFGVSQGPFELWQAAGWGQVAQWIKEDIEAGKALSNAPLPAWVFEGPVANNQGVHRPEGSWSPAHARWVPGSTLPVYQRQAFPENVLGADAPAALKSGTEEFRNDEVRVWSHDGEVLIASITAKLHLISPLVIEGLPKALEIAEAKYKGLVIWSPDDVFSAGANLESLMPVFMKAGAKGIEPEIKKLQDLMLRCAIRPCRSSRRCAASRSAAAASWRSIRRAAWPRWKATSGLVEVGVGLLPAGGGLTYIARRAAEMAGAANANADILAFLRDGFTNAAMAKVGTSAIESRRSATCCGATSSCRTRTSCCTSPARRPRRCTTAAIAPPARTPFPVAGRSAIATIKAQLANMRDGGFISQHDFHISALIADVLCGGDVDAGSLVTEEYLMTLERKHFCSLLEHPKSQERIMGMLQTGKPVDGTEPPESTQVIRVSNDGNDMSKQVQEAYIVAATRTPIGKAPRGYFKNTRSDDLLVLAIQSALKQVPTLDPKAIEDAIVGCSFPEGEQGMNMARIAVTLAGLPHSVGGITVNRFCASGLSAVQMAADRIRVGEADVMIAGGAESMSLVPMGGNKPSFNPRVFARRRERRHRLRHGADGREGRRAVEGHARGAGRVRAAVAPEGAEGAAERRVRRRDDGRSRSSTASRTSRAASRATRTRIVTLDEGPRPDTSIEGLAKLRPVFAAKGSVTAGNSSQTSDGAGALILASEKAVKQFDLKPLARFVSFASRGVPPEIMGIGPIEAIPGRAALCRPADRRHGLDRAERGVRRAGARGHRHRQARPREGQPDGRRDRARPPARRDRRDPLGDRRPRAAPPQPEVRHGDDVRRHRAGRRRHLRARLTPVARLLQRHVAKRTVPDAPEGVAMQTMSLVSDDGPPVAARLFRPADGAPMRGGVVIGGAMGVRQGLLRTVRALARRRGLRGADLRLPRRRRLAAAGPLAARLRGRPVRVGTRLRPRDRGARPRSARAADLPDRPQPRCAAARPAGAARPHRRPGVGRGRQRLLARQRAGAAAQRAVPLVCRGADRDVAVRLLSRVGACARSATCRAA